MGTDEEGTLATLKAHRRELIDPLLAQHHGRIFKTTGDGILIEFASVIDAVRCAVVIQQGMEERNASVAQSRRIFFRVGINLGDIIVEEGDIFGDGVNVAARLEALAQPGEIYVSASVREQVGEKLPVSFADIGEHKVKNIARPVHVYRIEKCVDPSAVGTPSANPTLSLPDRPSIAVLPFQNMSGDPDQEYFCDGVVEEVITGLSRIKGLFVIARNSSFTYKGRAVDVKQVGRELGVRYVLEGSVRKSGDRVRITTQLIEAETGRHLWAERYDRPIGDIFALQDEITLSVVGAIEPSLRSAEVERAKRKRPDSLDAYDLILRALPDVYSRMPEQEKKALVLAEQAIALDPNYALAHACAAHNHHTLLLRGDQNEEHRAAAIRHAQSAIALGQDDALALSFAGFVLGIDAHDRAAAFDAFDAAIAISPSTATTYIFGSIILAFAGDAEHAAEWAERSLRLSPLDPWRSSALFSLAIAHFQHRRYDEAVAAARKSVQCAPGFSTTHVLLAAALAKLGRIEEAKAAGSRVLALQPSFRYGHFLAGVNCVPELAASFGEALRDAGLPE
jgi:TolB-like protein/Tfp pilus assembly protein PilF